MIDECIRVDGARAAIFDAARYSDYDTRWFDADFYGRGGALRHRTTGRGGVLILDRGEESWVLRHYQRGGLVARFVHDHYLWTGLDRSRAFREWRLLARLAGLGLPSPRPIAARVVRQGPIYQADIVTGLIPGTLPLSSYLRDGNVADAQWKAIGSMLREFHAHGVEHPDLTAHNILIGKGEGVFLVDFDNARLRPPGEWQRAGLYRLERSLRKVALETGTRFDDDAWRLVLGAYGRG